MKRVIMGSLLGVMLLALLGCSTVKGASRDVSDGATFVWDGIKNMDSWFQEHAW